LDRGLFDAFQDLGEDLRKMGTREATLNKEHWLRELEVQEDARIAIGKLQIQGPYDFFKMDPQAYNLSIQYDKQMKADAKSQAKLAAKKAQQDPNSPQGKKSKKQLEQQV
jgi:hypothetical protein